MFGTCQISSQVRSDKYGGASLCCAQRRFRFQDTNLTVPTPHNWGDHITHEVCWSTLHAGKLHVQFGRRTEASASRRASSDPTNQMSKDEGGWNSSFSEKPVRSRLRRLVDWINLTGAKKVHSLIEKGKKGKNREMAGERLRRTGAVEV